MRSPDPLADGRPWHWAAAVALTLPLLLAVLPVCLVASLLRGGAGQGASPDGPAKRWKDGAMSEWTCGGVEPMPGVPRVRVVDERGREVCEGYYICHENRQLSPLGPSWLRPEDVDHCVAVDDFADWNMPRSLTIKKITPPHRIEIVDPAPASARRALEEGSHEPDY